MDSFAGLFIGDDLEYQTYLKNNPEVREELEKNTRQSLASTKTTTRISSSDVTPISEDDLTLLKRTIPRHDSTAVYMQPDINFYDKFYISDMSDTESKIPPEIVKNARKIKRIYRGNYLKYIDACCARDEYMSALIDAYGGEDLFQLKYFTKMCKDWIPPVPKYAKTSHDYDAVMSGVIDTSSLVPADPDMAQEIIDTLPEPDMIRISDGPVISKRENDVINNILDGGTNFGGRVKKQLGRVINLSEADILKSFNLETGYDDGTDSKNDDNKLFSETPDAYLANYINDGSIDSENRLIRLMNGEDISPVATNDRVYDSNTGRYMSERELENRKFIRHISEHGGWAEHKLMTLFNVGTRGERDRLELAARRTNNNKKKKSASMDEDIFGNSYTDYDDISDVSYNDLSIDDLMRR